MIPYTYMEAPIERLVPYYRMMSRWPGNRKWANDKLRMRIREYREWAGER